MVKTVLWDRHLNAYLREMIVSYLRKRLRALHLLVIIRVKNNERELVIK